GFHSLAGSAGIVALAGSSGLSVPDGSAAEPLAAGVVGKAVALVTGAGVPPGAGAGDAVASADRFLDTLADRLAIGVASVVAILDPGCVVLGGEVGQAGGEVLAARVEERIRRMSPLTTVVRPSG
uniref:ROK family protein n=1 Tax=Streptomyces sp. 4F14 TaxID=3394380 RepID=UPI003A8C0705